MQHACGAESHPKERKLNGMRAAQLRRKQEWDLHGGKRMQEAEKVCLEAAAKSL